MSDALQFKINDLEGQIVLLTAINQKQSEMLRTMMYGGDTETIRMIEAEVHYRNGHMEESNFKTIPKVGDFIAKDQHTHQWYKVTRVCHFQDGSNPHIYVTYEGR